MSLSDLIPVTIITGFLGSGKTTLLNHILRQETGQRIAVIENEFAAESIDNELLIQDRDEQIIEMSNGCICCSVRGDLIRILNRLAERRRAGSLTFDRVVIETTGLAAPGPVVQVFFMDPAIGDSYLLDAVLTVVDASNGWQQLDQHVEAQEQVGFADRLLVTKADLVDKATLNRLKVRLARINPRATTYVVRHGAVPALKVLDIRGFNLNALLEVAPDLMSDTPHVHRDDVTSFVYRTNRPLDMLEVGRFFEMIVQVFGPQMLRYKGVLHIAATPHRVVLQGVHMIFACSQGTAWKDHEVRESRIVFIGRDLPQLLLLNGLAKCVVDGNGPPVALPGTFGSA